MAIFKSKFYPFHTSQKNRVSNVAVKVAVTKNLVAVKGPQVAVVSGGSGSEGLPGSGNPGRHPPGVNHVFSNNKTGGECPVT